MSELLIFYSRLDIATISGAKLWYFSQTKTSILMIEVIMLMVAGAGLEPATSWL
jgi:hypothetical protein